MTKTPSPKRWYYQKNEKAGNHSASKPPPVNSRLDKTNALYLLVRLASESLCIMQRLNYSLSGSVSTSFSARPLVHSYRRPKEFKRAER